MCFLLKRKIENRQKYCKLIILCYENFGENNTPLKRYGMTAIPKIKVLLIRLMLVAKEHQDLSFK